MSPPSSLLEKNKNPLRDTVRWLACETAANIRADEICASRKLHARRVEQRIKGSGGINFQRNLIRGGIKKKKKNQQKAKQQNNENVRRKGKWKKREKKKKEKRKGKGKTILLPYNRKTN